MRYSWSGNLVVAKHRVRGGEAELLRRPDSERYSKRHLSREEWRELRTFLDETRFFDLPALELAPGVLLGGRIADYGGRKRAFLVGLVGFTIASALGGRAPNTAVLLIARGLQGVCAALLVPAALSLVRSAIKPASVLVQRIPALRTRNAIAVWTAICAKGGSGSPR